MASICLTSCVQLRGCTLTVKIVVNRNKNNATTSSMSTTTIVTINTTTTTTRTSLPSLSTSHSSDAVHKEGVNVPSGPCDKDGTVLAGAAGWSLGGLVWWLDSWSNFSCWHGQLCRLHTLLHFSKMCMCVYGKGVCEIGWQKWLIYSCPTLMMCCIFIENN